MLSYNLDNMTIIKINAITVPVEAGDELAHRFEPQSHMLDGHDGFLGFELLKPTDERTQWLVVTRWRDEKSFDAWFASPEFRAAHSRKDGETGERRKPVGTDAQLWSYDIVGGSEFVK